MDVRVERVIPLPPDRVANYAMDWRHDPEWTQGISTAELSAEADGGGFGAGAEVTRSSYFLGRRIDYVFQVVAHEPPCLLDLKSVAGPFPMRVTYRYDVHPDGTLASIQVRGGRNPVVDVVLRLLVRDHMRRDLRELARNLA
jgi:hypothetical protein